MGRWHDVRNRGKILNYSECRRAKRTPDHKPVQYGQQPCMFELSLICPTYGTAYLFEMPIVGKTGLFKRLKTKRGRLGDMGRQKARLGKKKENRDTVF